MSLAVSIELQGFDELRRRLAHMPRQIPFAQALAITRTGQDVRDSLKGHLKGIFDNPTAFTVNSVRLRPATKNDLQAWIWIRDEAFKGTPPAKYLLPQTTGTRRNAKRHERALQHAGILPHGWATVPGRGARLNRAGNISAGTYTKILSELRASPDGHQNATSRKAKPYFVMRRGERPIGVYQRTSKRRMQAVLHFIDELPGYGKEVRFQQVADMVVRRRGVKHMDDAIEHTIRTAR
ncbi:hypothetical protein [Salinicola avicenniae]|uniref:hypothetical protein n=1 Tax=Salinicola avicenniae TaxID=2916836 RepID=UPI0020730672|nr:MULTISPECIES: hypothetical protein [unclassified Salinicola]